MGREDVYMYSRIEVTKGAKHNPRVFIPRFDALAPQFLNLIFRETEVCSPLLRIVITAGLKHLRFSTHRFQRLLLGLLLLVDTCTVVVLPRSSISQRQTLKFKDITPKGETVESTALCGHERKPCPCTSEKSRQYLRTNLHTSESKFFQ